MQRCASRPATKGAYGMHCQLCNNSQPHLSRAADQLGELLAELPGQATQRAATVYQARQAPACCTCGCCAGTYNQTLRLVVK